jgi:hypothetical protein
VVSAKNPYLADSLIDTLPLREDAAGQRSSLELEESKSAAHEKNIRVPKYLEFSLAIKEYAYRQLCQ